MLRLTQELIADAIVHGTLTQLADPVAHALLEGGESVDECLAEADANGRASVELVLGDLIDLACTHGDAAMRGMTELKDWHTIGLSALIRSTSDHRLHTIADARSLERQLADALGLDYGSLRVGPYALHSLSALAMTASDFAKTCATMRLEAAQAMPAGVDSFYGLNERGTRDIHLAQQVQLFISVKATSAEDARQMARELHQWAGSASRENTLKFHLVDGSELTVGCLPLMAGLPWSLRKTAGFEIQALVLSELAELWARQPEHGGQPKTFCTVLDFDEEANVQAVRLVAWFGEEPKKAFAAVLHTQACGELLDEKLCRKLLEAGWSMADAEPGECPTSNTFRVAGVALPVTWDMRFAP